MSREEAFLSLSENDRKQRYLIALTYHMAADTQDSIDFLERGYRDVSQGRAKIAKGVETFKNGPGETKKVIDAEFEKISGLHKKVKMAINEHQSQYDALSRYQLKLAKALGPDLAKPFDKPFKSGDEAILDEADFIVYGNDWWEHYQPEAIAKIEKVIENKPKLDSMGLPQP